VGGWPTFARRRGAVIRCVGAGGDGLGRRGSSPPPPICRPVPRCASGGSRSSAPNAAIRSSIGGRRALGAAACRRLTRSFTPLGTWSSAVSTSSNSSRPWPPATPNAPPTTPPRSSSPRSCCGCAQTGHGLGLAALLVRVNMALPGYVGARVVRLVIFWVDPVLSGHVRAGAIRLVAVRVRIVLP
jgi:hypothetical protein